MDEEGEGDADDESEDDEIETTPLPGTSHNDRKTSIMIQETKYVVELKLPKAWKSSFVRRQSDDYIRFKEKIESQLKKELSDQFTSLDVKVMDLHSAGLESADSNEIATIAKLKLSVRTISNDSIDHSKIKIQESTDDSWSPPSSRSTTTASSSSSGSAATPVRLTEALNLAIRDGHVGDVAVDSTYLIIRSLGKSRQS